MTIEPSQLVIAAGVHPALIATLKAFSPKGTKVLLQTPTYNGFYGDLTASQTLAEEVPLKFANGKFAMDFEQFEKQISVDTNSFILCNPQNPTGNCWSAEDLTRIGEICLKHRVVVLADEIHCDFVAKGQKYTPFASLPNKAIVDNSITFKAASKSFGLAAHKTAWFYSTNAGYMERIKVHHRADLNTLGVIANQGAYSPEGEEWLNQVVEYIDGNTSFAADFINTKLPGVKTAKPQGTYLMWLDFTELAEQDQHQGDGRRLQPHQGRQRADADAGADARALPGQERARCTSTPGTAYGKGSDNHMRMNVGDVAPHAGAGAQQPRRRADQDLEHVAPLAPFRLARGRPRPPPSPVRTRRGGPRGWLVGQRVGRRRRRRVRNQAVRDSAGSWRSLCQRHCKEFPQSMAFPYLLFAVTTPPLGVPLSDGSELASMALLALVLAAASIAARRLPDSRCPAVTTAPRAAPASRRRLHALDRDRLDADVLHRPILTAGGGLADRVDDVHALGDLAEDRVLVVEPRRRHQRDEELAAVGVRPGVGHRQDAALVVLAGPARTRPRTGSPGRPCRCPCGQPPWIMKSAITRWKTSPS